MIFVFNAIFKRCDLIGEALVGVTPMGTPFIITGLIFEMIMSIACAVHCAIPSEVWPAVGANVGDAFRALFAQVFLNVP